MAFCGNCGNQLEDGAKFCPKCGQATDGSTNQQPQYKTQEQEVPPIKPDSNMLLAILSTIFCCLPTGIYAIILANKVDSLYYAGAYDEAEEAANGAKKWSIIGAVLAIVGILFYVIFFVLLAAGAAASAY